MVLLPIKLLLEKMRVPLESTKRTPSLLGPTKGDMKYHHSYTSILISSLYQWFAFGTTWLSCPIVFLFVGTRPNYNLSSVFSMFVYV